MNPFHQLLNRAGFKSLPLKNKQTLKKIKTTKKNLSNKNPLQPQLNLFLLCHGKTSQNNSLLAVSILPASLLTHTTVASISITLTNHLWIRSPRNSFFTTPFFLKSLFHWVLEYQFPNFILTSLGVVLLRKLNLGSSLCCSAVNKPD